MPIRRRIFWQVMFHLKSSESFLVGIISGTDKCCTKMTPERQLCLQNFAACRGLQQSAPPVSEGDE